VFKLDLGISYKWYGFGVERPKVEVRVRITAIRRGFELHKCLLVFIARQHTAADARY